MSEVGSIAGVAGTAFKVIGDIRSGIEQEMAAQYNADKLNKYASLVEAQGDENARRQMIQARLSMGAAQAGFAHAGVTSEGSPIDVLARSAENAELDNQTIKSQAKMKADSMREDANMERMRGSNALEASGYQMAADALMGGAQAVSNYGGKIGKY